MLKNSPHEFSASQFAIREYRQYKAENQFIHDARVMVKRSDSIVYNDILKVDARIDTNLSYVNIVWDKNEDSIFHATYNNAYQKFRYHNGGLLVISNTTDFNDHKIEIHIF